MSNYDPENVERFTPWVIQYDDFASTEQAAECLNVSLSTLARWRKKGVGPSFVRFGFKGIGYRWKELVKFAPPENLAKIIGALLGSGAGFMR